MDGSHNLCQISKTGHEDDWKQLYESSFPADERHPVEDLRKLITNGTVLLHRTTNKSGELLCFSIANLMSDFNLLAYIATDSTKRSTGVGSKHMKKLVEEMKTAHPAHVGMFLEIESTKESGLDADTHKARTRRLAFYQRLGAKRMHKTYLMPSYGTSQGTAEARQGELLWIEFSACINESSLPKIIEEIFCKGYGLSNTDKVVQKVLGQFKTTDASKSTCAEAAQTATTSTTSGAEVKPTETLVPAKPSDTPMVAEVPAKSAEATPVADHQPAKPAETPVVAEQPAKPVETPVVEEQPVKPAETPLVEELPAKPAETPVVEEQPAKPAETPAVAEQKVQTAESETKALSAAQ